MKGIHLEGLRVLGRPSDFARYYYENGADELLFMDVVASLYERNSLHDIISETAASIFIPFTVGGGLRSIDDMREVLRAGADKVAINTAAIKNPELVREASHIFGSSTIVVAIEAIRERDGRYLAYTDNGREHTGIEVVEWAKKVAELGAGEILLTSVDREGTGEGFDIELVQKVSAAVDIRVIAHGGAGTVNDIARLIEATDIEAFSVASMFHYHFLQGNQSTVSTLEGNNEFLRKSSSSSKLIEPASIQDVKMELLKREIECRI